MPDPPDDLMTVAEVAAILKLNQQTVRNCSTLESYPPCAWDRDGCGSTTGRFEEGYGGVGYFVGGLVARCWLQ
jgi:hypothetical protein